MSSKDVTTSSIEISYHKKEMSTNSTFDVIQTNGNSGKSVKSGLLTAQRIHDLEKSTEFRLDYIGLYSQLIMCEETANNLGCYFDAYLRLNTSILVFDNLNHNQQSLSFLRIIVRNHAGEIFFEDLSLASYPIVDISNVFEQLLARATENLKTLVSYTGQAQIIFAPKAASYFIHEIVGHQCEYDYALSPNAYINTDGIGMRVLSNEANIISDPFINEFMKLGTVDDEGSLLEKQIIVENGYLRGFIHSKRCDSHYHETIYRMTNLCLLPNPAGRRLEDILLQSGDTILVNSFVYGAYSPDANQFTLFSNDCYLQNGQKRKAKLSQFVIQQDIEKINTMIHEVGSDMKLFLAICSKLGQPVFVCNGAPSLVVNL